MLTFENQVPPQPLAQVSRLPTGPTLQLDFVTGALGPQQIRMPEQGSFELIVAAGPSFQIADNDATDGMAKVVLPRQIYDIYVGVGSYPASSDKVSQNASLQHPCQEGKVTSDLSGSIVLEDGLYYVRQNLAVSSEQKWFVMSGRPLPTPADWHSPDGSLYVLKLTNSGLKKLTTTWLPGQQENFPPGIKEIGPEGGIVELSGIGKLELPVGALNSKIVISLRQQLQAQLVYKYSFQRRKMTLQEDFASPVVKIEPKGLTLNIPAYLYLNTNQNRFGNNHPATLHWSCQIGESGDGYFIWDYIPNKDYDSIPIAQWNSNMAGIIREFAVCAKTMNIGTKPGDGTNVIESQVISSDPFQRKHHRG